MNVYFNVSINIPLEGMIENEKNGLKIYPTALYMHSNKDKQSILEALNKRAGHVIKFKVNIINDFILTHRGKFMNIVKKF